MAFQGLGIPVRSRTDAGAPIGDVSKHEYLVIDCDFLQKLQSNPVTSKLGGAWSSSPSSALVNYLVP